MSFEARANNGQFAKPTTIRERAEQDRTCSCCSNPLMAGEVSFRDEQTGLIGCSIVCLEDAKADHTDQEEIQQFRVQFESI